MEIRAGESEKLCKETTGVSEGPEKGRRHDQGGGRAQKGGDPWRGEGKKCPG
jgi:hypothetical protein